MLRPVLGLLAMALGLGAQPLSVRDSGAKGDGKTDDTPAFVAALAKAKAAGTGVLVPKGTYRLTQPLVLENIVLRGPEGAAWPADIDALPTLLPDHRDGPCCRLLAGGAMRGLNIDYKWAKEPEKGPPAIRIEGIGVFLSNLRIRYPWDGILTDGEHNVGRLNIENVFMVSPRNVGVRVTGTWDVPRLSNVEVWNAGPVKRGLTKGIGFHLGKNDLIRLTDCFVFAMQTGFLLEDEIKGCKIKGATWGVMNGCATDYCGRSIVVRGDHTLSVSGGTFWTHGESLIVEQGKSRVRVTGSELKSNGAPCVVVRGGDHTIVTGCTLLRPMKEHPGWAVRLQASGTVFGSNTVQSTRDGIEITGKKTAAVVTGNLLQLPGQAVLDKTGKGVVKDNLTRAPAGE